MSAANQLLKPGEKVLRQKLLLTAGVGFLTLYSLLCFAVIPVQLALQADIAAVEWAVQLVNYLRILTELCALILFYATLILGACRLGTRYFAGAFLLFAAATAYKYLANTLMDWIRYGAVPGTVLWDLIDVLFYVVLESVQLWIIVMILRRSLPVCRSREEALSLVHFTRFYDHKFPVMRASLYVSIVVFVSKTVGTPLSDLAYMIMGGLPKDSNTWLQMGMVYLLEVVTALLYAGLCYLGLVLLLPRLAKGLEKAEV